MSTQAYCLYPRGSNSVRGIYHGSKPEEVVITVQNDGVICYNSIRRVRCRTNTQLETQKQCMHRVHTVSQAFFSRPVDLNGRLP